jgi:hypothetical protein
MKPVWECCGSINTVAESPLSSYISYSSNVLSANFPALPISNKGTYSIKITLNVDSASYPFVGRCSSTGLKDYFFNLNVLNRPPIFNLPF